MHHGSLRQVTGFMGNNCCMVDSLNVGKMYWFGCAFVITSFLPSQLHLIATLGIAIAMDGQVTYLHQ